MLSRLDKWLCGALVSRQIDHGRRIRKEVEKYGPCGTVLVCSARAWQTYTLLFALLGVGFAIADVTAIAVAAFLAMSLAGAFAITRAIRASKVGRQWRAHYAQSG
jgi:hypothetical protein